MMPSSWRRKKGSNSFYLSCELRESDHTESFVSAAVTQTADMSMCEIYSLLPTQIITGDSVTISLIEEENDSHNEAPE